MKSAIFAAVALAVPAIAQMIPGLPACATPCLANSASISGCRSTDYKCVCSSKPYIQYAAACFQQYCTADQLTSAATAAHAFCQSQGVNLSTVEPQEPTTDTTLPTTTPMTPPTMMTPTKTPTMPPTKTPMMPPTKTPMMPPPETPTGVTTSYPPTANVSTPYPTTTETTTETTTLYAGTTTTINGTGTSVTVSRNITNPTVVPPGNNQSAAVKNIAGLGAIVMAIAGFFAL